MKVDPFPVAVAAERGRQDAKWGPQRHRWAEWLSILVEEVGEASEQTNGLTWHDRDGARVGLRYALRTELVQVAAVACAMVEQLDEELAALDRRAPADGAAGGGG